MAFPQITTHAESQETTNQTTHNVTLPSGIQAGDLLILIVGTNNDNSVTIAWNAAGSGWVELGQEAIQNFEHKLAAAYKFAAGDATDNADYTTTAGEESAAICLRITGAHASTPPEYTPTEFESASTDANPPSLNPANWDVEDTLWIAIGSTTNGTLTVSTYPYAANNITSASAGTDGVRVAIATTENAAASNDPGNFVFSGTDTVGGAQIAVRPAAVTVKATVRRQRDMAAA